MSIVSDLPPQDPEDDDRASRRAMNGVIRLLMARAGIGTKKALADALSTSLSQSTVYSRLAEGGPDWQSYEIRKLAEFFRVPVAALFADPTIEGVAAAIGVLPADLANEVATGVQNWKKMNPPDLRIIHGSAPRDDRVAPGAPSRHGNATRSRHLHAVAT